ncbi:MAG: RyR domain-containing protein [Clostridiales bacterium]|jgi:hypothetical protein|nr:RyR domain-containing protein [Clostridiales bacterium]MDR2711851.1 hypothetical protein [Clostridiales bacterium]
MGILICGHAYTRVFTHIENGIRYEFSAPGGAELLKALLNAEPASELEGERREFFELGYVIDKPAKKEYYSIIRRAGAIGNKMDVISGPAKESRIIWDEGFGGICLPGDQPPTLWASKKSLPDKNCFDKAAVNGFLFLDADILRTAGALISRQISWERTATELIWQIQNNPVLSYLLKAPHILIAFAEDGAVYIKRENGEIKASLVLTHGGGEGILREKLKGEIDDAFILMTASLAKQFPAVLSGKEPLLVLPLLRTAEALMNSGYTIAGLENSQFTIITETEEAEIAFEIPLTPDGNVIGRDNWCISNNVGDKRVFDIAYNYVRVGAKEIEGLPQLSFGAFTTVDRFEIEAFQNIRNLIVGYDKSDSVRPLSIAVFGSPGSGKSFGVTQIAKNVLPDIVEKLEFNVSQFRDLNDLSAAFQKVRDLVLEGKLPLVFFDEFDSDKDGLLLGWLKSFIMPMQDGKFKDNSGEHPLGKCILVFAGGTSANFEEFMAPMSHNGQLSLPPHFSEEPINHLIIENGRQKYEDFKNIKGPDFVSRLKGIINVLGPNPKDKDDKNYILRRALLLRSLCERKFKMKNGIAPVSKNIIWAMLLVPEYKHGARSMEAILEMSRLEGNVWEPVSLPFYSQLDLHVDAAAFIKLVLRKVILNSYVDKLAIAIHEDYRKKMQTTGHGDYPSVVLWDDLPEEFKDSNRNQARHIGRKLKEAGYNYDAGDTSFSSVEVFDEEIVLLMAKNEHIRWLDEKIAGGWKYDPVRDDANKSHPLLIEWKNLPDEEKQKDINAVQNIIPLLKSVGLRVYKMI